jgi:hypothetical protein
VYAYSSLYIHVCKGWQTIYAFSGQGKVYTEVKTDSFG